MSTVLDAELATYEREKPGLLAKHAGKFVLIKADKVLGVYESQNDAIDEGWKLFPGQPILTKRIEALEVPVFMPHVMG
jgi:hypothetical protein